MSLFEEKKKNYGSTNYFLFQIIFWVQSSIHEGTCPSTFNCTDPTIKVFTRCSIDDNCKITEKCCYELCNGSFRKRCIAMKVVVQGLKSFFYFVMVIFSRQLVYVVIILVTQCPRENEEYRLAFCGCKPTCENYKSATCSVNAASFCLPGCYCKDGFYKNSAGNCVTPDHCP